MVCPYAKQIRGTIALCSLINRKVSTLRYPCKGNYRRCPIYNRYAAARETLPSEATEAKPAKEIASLGEARQQTVKEKVAPEAAPSRIEVKAKSWKDLFKPSEALCDSLILASLTVSGKAVGIYRGSLSGLVKDIQKYLKEGEFLLVVGDIGGYRARILFMGELARFAFEKDGNPICGEDASKVLEEVAESTIDAVVYSVRLEDIPLWKDRILKELS